MLASQLLALAGLVSLSTAGYVLEDDYSGSSFFSMMDFFTDADPTHGYVTYVDQGTAQKNGLINTNNGVVYMGVDHTNVASGSGRSSVRVTSKKSYNHGLVILDLAHMPGSICGAWPAFWMVGPNWPNNGEIDIIEGVNSQSTNAMTLHTGPGCSVSNNGGFSGHVATSNCDINAAGQPQNAGCSIDTSNTASYGDGFNAGNGGVYATEWTSQAISIWFFPRTAIPSDISSGNPNPANWGSPTASFSSSSCNIDKFFKNQQIVFDTTFCGDWAGNVWSTDAVCKSKASTCQAFVQNNPSAFANAYWTVNSLRVYQSNGVTAASVPQPSATRTYSVSVPVSTAPNVPATTNPVPSVSEPTSSGKPSFSQRRTRSAVAGNFFQVAGTSSAAPVAEALPATTSSTLSTGPAPNQPAQTTAPAPTSAGGYNPTKAVVAAIAAGTPGGPVLEVAATPIPSSSTTTTSTSTSTSTGAALQPSSTAGGVPDAVAAVAAAASNTPGSSVSEWGNIEFPGEHHKRHAHRHLVKHGRSDLMRRW